MPLALRAWLRYLVPFTLLGAIATAPVWLFTLRAGAPQDLAQARAALRLVWLLACFAWIWQLWLVAGVAPAVRSVRDGSPLSQLAAFIGGLRGLVRGAIPVAIAVLAILLGGLALAIPGLLLLGLLALTGASDQIRDAPSAALLDSIAVVRASWKRVAITLGVIVLVTLLVVIVSQRMMVPRITSKVPPAKLVPFRALVRVVGVAIAGSASLAASAIAALYPRR